VRARPSIESSNGFPGADGAQDVLQAAVQEIARGWKEDPDTLPWLKERPASDENSDVRQAAIRELGKF
jgi:hypothetical protein